MMDMKKNSSRGVIMVHTPLPVSLLRSQFQDVTVASDCRKILSQMTRNIRNMRSASSRQEQLSSASLRRLQVKIESENQQMTEIIQPLVDTENTLIKELQSFLELRDVTELRRKELLHKSWTERVWFPLQRKVEQHLNYLQHCNAKGFVFLETYDLKEYDPFPLSTTKPNYFKLRTAALKDPFPRCLHETLQEKTACGAGK
uniref:Protein FAM228B n=1 Tax=Amphiprion ocellaris TaxID=80972 RepID=A0AAQ5YYN6_AMPOC